MFLYLVWPIFLTTNAHKLIPKHRACRFITKLLGGYILRRSCMQLSLHSRPVMCAYIHVWLV